MSSLSMGQVVDLGRAGLGGFLQVGPHYFPPRPGGVQVIMRGPHGQRLAANPVYLREHDQPRGSGFRFWVEELNIPADVKWNPQQVVTGVMGLGGLGGSFDRLRWGGEIQSALDRTTGVARSSGSIAASALQSAISQAARQNDGGSQAALTKAASETARVRGAGAVELADLLDKELNQNVSPLVSQHFSRTPAEQARYMQGVTAQEQAWERYADPGQVHRDLLLEEEQRRINAGECVSWFKTPAYCAAKYFKGEPGSVIPPFAKYVLVGGAVVLGVVALSSFAKGVGSGLGSRARSALDMEKK